MPNITHTISTSAGADTILGAITSLDGLRSWWTSDTSGDPAQGGLIEFRFGGGGPDMSVEHISETDVIWKCVSGPEEWLGTTIEFRMQQDEGDKTAVYFTHRGWADETPFHYHCSMKWAVFLLSLKAYLDLGEGRPFPNDIQIIDPTTKKAT